MLKKTIKILFGTLVTIGIFELLIFLTEPITRKKELEKVDEVKVEVHNIQAYAFIRALEDYCTLERIKGTNMPSKITNPDTIEFRGKKPKEMDMDLNNNCLAKGTFKYGNTVYQYDYETGKITLID